MDWADEQANELMRVHDSAGVLDLDRETLAAALRKAKADGMREAAGWIERLKPDGKGLTYMEGEAVLAACSVAANSFRDRASAIEKGME